VLPNQLVANVAFILTYNAANLTKFFKRFGGCTPKQYREQVRAEQRELAELLTI
jgi:AraC family transcriptional regulator of adaptative response / methylphosphotriester-DNA alkyltransferase methyltransferase